MGPGDKLLSLGRGSIIFRDSGYFCFVSQSPLKHDLFLVVYSHPVIATVEVLA
jgi:hypothetical protein